MDIVILDSIILLMKKINSKIVLFLWEKIYFTWQHVFI